jgi:NAD(P)-dependent dehydrogenase (short-subunit alcohol dehydrogenase family)
VQRTVLVTGAGSGIGLATAVEAARLGFRAVAAVHRAEQLGDVQAAAAEAGLAASVDAAVLDVTDDVAAADLVERVEPWAVVASAGLTNSGLIEDVTADRRVRSVRPAVYDRGIDAIDGVRERAADPARVAAVVGGSLRAAHPRFRYRSPTVAVPFAVAARLVPTSIRDRVVRTMTGL